MENLKGNIWELAEEKNFENGNIMDIKIETEYCDVQIKKTTQSKIFVRLMGKIDAVEKPEWQAGVVKNGVLDVKFCPKKCNYSSLKLQVYIPEFDLIKKTEIKCTNGSVIFETETAELVMDIRNGNVIVNTMLNYDLTVDIHNRNGNVELMFGNLKTSDLLCSVEKGNRNSEYKLYQNGGCVSGSVIVSKGNLKIGNL